MKFLKISFIEYLFNNYLMFIIFMLISFPMFVALFFL